MNCRWGGNKCQPVAGKGGKPILTTHTNPNENKRLLYPHPRPQAPEPSNPSQALPPTVHLIQVTLRHFPKTL